MNEAGKAGKKLAPAPEGAAAEYVGLDALHPWAKNPKGIEPKDVRELARAIRRFGFGAPIVARRANGEIIEGHLRYAAAKRLKLETVPVRFMDISESEAHVLAVAATKLTQRGDFDDKALAHVLEELEADGADLELGTGFDEDEVDKLLGVEDVALPTDDGDTRPKKGRSRLGGLAYRILVQCTDEDHQAALVARFEADGLDCRPLMS